MSSDALFCSLSYGQIAGQIRFAQQSVCFAAPGVQQVVADAMVETAKRLGPEMITVSVDFDERTMRMGYGHIEAIEKLRAAGILVQSAPGLRTALVVVDEVGFIFTPTPLYLEGEPTEGRSLNAMRMSGNQVTAALARLSPAAKAIAVAQAKTPEEKALITALPVDVDSKPVEAAQFAAIAAGLKQAPPVEFDLARQVRVFEPYMQYVELSLTGAAIQHHTLAIPSSIQKLGGSQELDDRLRTTFTLIERGSKLSSKPLEDTLNEIRKNFTPSLGHDHGRVVLKAAKPRLVTRLTAFRKKLEEHQKSVEAGLQQHLDESREKVIEYYLPRVVASPPDALLGQLLTGKPTDDDAKRWLDAELDKVFPSAQSLIQGMKLEERFKDVTYETLNRPDFLQSVKEAFPNIDWDKAYGEFLAAGEKKIAADK